MSWLRNVDYRKLVNVVNRAQSAILVRTQKTRMLIRMCKLKAKLMRFQTEIRTLLRTGLEAIHVTFWKKKTSLHFMYAKIL